MATFTRGQTFGATETVTNTKLHNLVDNATISNIVDADISAAAAIQFSKLLASSISGALFTNLSLIPAAAGLVPFANLPVPFGSSYVSLVTIPNQSLIPLTLASWVSGLSFQGLQSIPTAAGQFAYSALVQSLSSGALPVFDGVSKFVGSNGVSARQVFLSNGTFTAPAGVTRIFITMAAGGGGGGAASDSNGSAGGGGGGAGTLRLPYTVTPGNGYAITIGGGGAGGSGSSTGSAGSSTTFNDVTVTGGNGGTGTSSTGSVAGGAGGTNPMTGIAGANNDPGEGGFAGLAGGTGGASSGDGTGFSSGGGGGGSTCGRGGTGAQEAGTGGAAVANSGGGGGGGAGLSGTGGAGGSGICIIEW